MLLIVATHVIQPYNRVRIVGFLRDDVVDVARCPNHIVLGPNVSDDCRIEIDGFQMLLWDSPPEKRLGGLAFVAVQVQNGSRGIRPVADNDGSTMDFFADEVVAHDA